MPKEIHRQRTWNAGELDPDLIGRDDVNVTPNGAALIENFQCIPQGPLVRRPGLPRVDVVRHPLVAVDFAAAALTAPNGGVAANARVADGTKLLTTTDLGVINGYVVLEIDFAAPVAVGLVDVVDYGLHDTSGGGTPPAGVPISFPWGDLGLGLFGGFYNIP